MFIVFFINYYLNILLNTVCILRKNYNTTISDTKHFFINKAIDVSRQMFPSMAELRVS